jgi:hypothetical protein
MTAPRRYLLAVLGVAILIAALVIGQASTPVQGNAFRFDYPEGRRFTYRLDYQAESALKVGAGEKSKILSGKVDLGGELVLRGLGKRMVGLSLQKLTRHQIVLLDHEAFADLAKAQALLTGHEALLELSPHGDVISVSFRPEDPLVFKNLIQTLVGELQILVREGERWTVDERTQRGVASAAYAIAGEDDHALQLTKERLGYRNLVGVGEIGAEPELTSSFRATLLKAGQLDELTARERLQGNSTVSFELKLKLVDEAAFEVAAADVAGQTQKVAPAELVQDTGVEARMLEDQIDGLTEAVLFDNVRLYALGAPIKDHNHFLIQAVALLQKYPELCPKLAELFKDPSTNTRGRAFALDLLANAGTPAAQAALRDALGSPAALSDKNYDVLFSRFSLVRQPTPETVQFVDETYRQAPAERRVTAAYALGSTAGALHHGGQEAEAAPALARLMADLSAAKTAKEESDLLISLGNAGVVENVPALIVHAASSSADVRQATAMALRKTQTAQAQAALLDFAFDPAPAVQQEAFRVLPRFKLDGVARRQLLDGVLAGRVSMKSYNELVTLLAPYLEQDPGVREVFQFLLRQEVVDREVHTRIQSLLGPS